MSNGVAVSTSDDVGFHRGGGICISKRKCTKFTNAVRRRTLGLSVYVLVVDLWRKVLMHIRTCVTTAAFYTLAFYTLGFSRVPNFVHDMYIYMIFDKRMSVVSFLTVCNNRNV